jgi:hypothetical protein
MKWIRWPGVDLAFEFFNAGLSNFHTPATDFNGDSIGCMKKSAMIYFAKLIYYKIIF